MKPAGFPCERVQSATPGSRPGSEVSITASLPIGQGTDGAEFDPSKRLAFSSDGDGTLTVVQAASGQYEVIGNVQTQRGARTMTVDAKTHRIYLPAAQFGPVPAATAQQPRPRPVALPDSFVMIVVGP